jgi:hypothetical protein
MNKIAVVVLADPNTGTEEVLGRVFNALAVVYDCKQRGTEVTLVFQGAGARYPAALANPEHPAHALFESVKDKIAGVSYGCAVAFGAEDDATRQGFNLLKELSVPGAADLASLRRLIGEGYTVITF